MTATNTTSAPSPAPEPLSLETETCSRCGGSGQYSYCTMYGSRCFKCHGKGKVYTKRGAIAADYLKTLRSKRAADLKPGDLILDEGIPGFAAPRWVKVEIVEPDTQTPGRLVIICNKINFSGYQPDHMFRLGQTAEQKVETLKQAIEFQNTLTKTGKPRRR